MGDRYKVSDELLGSFCYSSTGSVKDCNVTGNDVREFLVEFEGAICYVSDGITRRKSVPIPFYNRILESENARGFFGLIDPNKYGRDFYKSDMGRCFINRGECYKKRYFAIKECLKAPSDDAVNLIAASALCDICNDRFFIANDAATVQAVKGSELFKSLLENGSIIDTQPEQAKTDEVSSSVSADTEVATSQPQQTLPAEKSSVASV